MEENKNEEDSFLKKHTQIREDVLNQKLFFELKESSAMSEIHLKIHKVDVDVDGFDIILDNNDDLLIKCQLKSTFEATTDMFEIHKIMLKPKSCLFNDFDFFEPHGCPNDDRGIILIDGCCNEDKTKIITRYYYLDIFLLRAMELEMFKYKNKHRQPLENLMRELRCGTKSRNYKLNINKSLFFPVKDIQSLLVIIGFHSSETATNITYNIRKVSKIYCGLDGKTYNNDKERISAMTGDWNYVNETLKDLIYPEDKDSFMIETCHLKKKKKKNKMPNG
jgi:hypothetical protein